MAKTENPIGKGTRQIVINLHTEEERAPQGSILNLGEIAVQGTNSDAKLYTKRANGEVAVFIESATTHNAIQAAITEVEGYVEAQGFEYSANTAAMSGYIETTYATSADTESAIATAKEEVIGDTGSTSADTTIYGAKAYTDEKVKEAVAGSVNGAVGGNYIDVDVIDNIAVISADTQAVASADNDNKGLAEASDVKAYVDGVSGSIETQINTVSGNVETKINEVSGNIETKINEVSGSIETQINTVSGYLETAISDEESARTQADTELSGRIAALEAISADTQSALQEVTATGDTYVTASVAGKSAITVSTVTGSVEDGEDKLAVASDVKEYVAGVSGSIETQINTVSGNIETTINTVSGNIETKINQVSGNIETTINSFSGDVVDEIARVDGRIDAIESGSVVTVEKLGTPSSSAYAATYIVKQNGSQVGDAIDIPKDYLVKSATIEVCETADVPVAGLQPGDKYIDFVVNAKDGQGEESHIYLPVTDLVDVYTEGDGIEISTGNVVSAKVVAANGLSVDSNGIAMSLADGSNNGAMSSADYTKLAGVASGAQVNVLEGVQVNGTDLTIDGNKKVNIIMSAATGDNNGQVKINGENIDVKGLGSAAYSAATDFDLAGAANAVLGTTADTSANTTVYGVKDYVDQKVAAVVLNSVTAATGDNYVSAEVVNNEVVVEASQDVKNAVASAHNHDNKDVLDTITSAKTEAWDNAEQNAKDYADGIVSGFSGNIITYVNTASGNLETAINNEETARTQADTELSDRIAALEAISGKTESALQEVTATGDTFVTAQVDGKSAITVSTVTGSVASDSGKLAVTDDVKSYVDTLSGNVVTALGDYATSADTESAISTAKEEVIGNTGNTSADTTIYGVREYVNQKVADGSIASVDVNNKDAMAISATTVDRAVTLDFTNMIIDCGTY